LLYKENGPKQTLPLVGPQSSGIMLDLERKVNK